jgi:hypothetical protein
MSEQLHPSELHEQTQLEHQTALQAAETRYAELANAIPQEQVDATLLRVAGIIEQAASEEGLKPKILTEREQSDYAIAEAFVDWGAQAISGTEAQNDPKAYARADDEAGITANSNLSIPRSYDDSFKQHAEKQAAHITKVKDAITGNLEISPVRRAHAERKAVIRDHNIAVNKRSAESAERKLKAAEAKAQADAERVESAKAESARIRAAARERKAEKKAFLERKQLQHGLGYMNLFKKEVTAEADAYILEKFGPVEIKKQPVPEEKPHFKVKVNEAARARQQRNVDAIQDHRKGYQDKVQPTPVVDTEALRLQERQKRILDQYGVHNGTIKTLAQGRKNTDTIKVLEAYDLADADGQGFLLEFTVPDENGDAVKQTRRVTGSEFLKFTEKSDARMTAKRRKRPTEGKEVVDDAGQEFGALTRIALREHFAENTAIEPKPSLLMRAKMKVMDAYIGATSDSETAVSRRRFALAGAVGAFASYLVLRGQLDHGTAAALAQPNGAPKANHLYDVLPASEAPKGHVQLDTMPIHVSGGDQAPDIIHVNVNPGDGYTHVIERYAEAHGQHPSPDQLHSYYEQLHHNGSIDPANSYMDQGGEFQIDDPSKTVGFDKSDLDNVISGKLKKKS